MRDTRLPCGRSDLSRRGRWREQYAWIREGYTQEEEHRGIRGMTERMLVSHQGDAERLAKAKAPGKALVLKRGILEYLPSPYTLVTGGDNQPILTQGPRLAFARMLRSDKMIDTVARDVHYFVRNYYNADGLGDEGSPAYANCAWGIRGLLDELHGLKGDFDKAMPYHDPQLNALNPFRDPVMRDVICKFVYCLFPDGNAIPWEDSHCGARMYTTLLERVENWGGGIPAHYDRFLTKKQREDGTWQVGVASDLTLPSRLLHESRKAVLRAGRGREQAVVALDFTATVGHAHYAPVSLVVYGKGHELASDLGYMSSGHQLMRWIRTCPAHNCLTLRAADGSPRPSSRPNLRGDARKLFAISPLVKVMDAAEEDPADLKALPEPDRALYQRTTALISAGGGDHYVLDICRARGAPIHDWYFHSHGQRFETGDIGLAALKDPDQSLYDHSGFKFRCGKETACRCSRRLRTGKADGSWSATWGEVIDWRVSRGEKRVVDRDVRLRLTVLGAPGTEVIAGEAPAQRCKDNRDRGATMTVVCARRKGGTDLDKFVAIIEPYRGEPLVKSAHYVSVTPQDETAVGLKVAKAGGPDYILSANNGEKPVTRTLRDGERTLVTDAEFAVASYAGEELRCLFLAAGTFAESGGHSIRLAPSPAGLLLDFNGEDKTLVVQADRPIPTGDALRGRAMFVTHREGRSSFTVEHVEKLDEARYQIKLEGAPHLATNTLLVTGAEGDGIVVGPPPVLPRAKTANFNVYHRERTGAVRLLGPLLRCSWKEILDEWGTARPSQPRVHVANAGAVGPGDEIALTMLWTGHDRFLIPNVASLEK